MALTNYRNKQRLQQLRNLENDIRLGQTCWMKSFTDALAKVRWHMHYFAEEESSVIRKMAIGLMRISSHIDLANADIVETRHTNIENIVSLHELIEIYLSSQEKFIDLVLLEIDETGAAERYVSEHPEYSETLEILSSMGT